MPAWAFLFLLIVFQGKFFYMASQPQSVNYLYRFLSVNRIMADADVITDQRELNGVFRLAKRYVDTIKSKHGRFKRGDIT